jgi:hypothetical protein
MEDEVIAVVCIVGEKKAYAGFSGDDNPNLNLDLTNIHSNKIHKNHDLMIEIFDSIFKGMKIASEEHPLLVKIKTNFFK